MEQNKKYYAFISYKREDERWAKWLQHKLEHYKLPSNLNGRTDLPREIRPVFRDTSELNPGNLPQQIHGALVASRHLIVICSPHSAQSEWVNKEVETFIAMGKQDCIIPFIIEGRPYAEDSSEECFPPAIRNLPKEQELLGANITEMGRDAAAVKTVAQMFGVRFDTLWKRYEREQKYRRAMVVAAVALFILAVLGVAAYIWRQNSELTKSKAELQEAYDNLTTANKETEREKNRAVQAERYLANANDSIQYQYGIIEQTNFDLIRTNNAKSLAQSRAVASAAMKLIEDGDAFTARKVALEALDISYTPEAEKALRAAHYQNSGTINGHTDSVHSARFNDDGTLLVSASSDRTIRVWDVNTLKEIYSLKGHTSAVNSAVFSPDGRHIASASSDKTIRIWDTHSKTCVKKLAGYHDVPIKSVLYSPDGKMLMSGSKNKIIIWDVNKYSIIKQYESSDGKEIKACFHPNGKDIVMFNERTLRIEDINTGEIEYTKYVPHYLSTLDKSLIKNGESEISSSRIISNFSISPSGKYIACSDTRPDTLYVIDVSMDTIISFYVGVSATINSITYVNDRQVFTSTFDGKNNLWDIGISSFTGASIHSAKQFVLKRNEDINLSVSNDGSQLVAASSDGSIHFWSIYPRRKGINLIDGNRLDFFSPIVIIPKGRLLGIDRGRWGRSLKEWNIATGKAVDSIKLPENIWFTILPSKDCSLIAISPLIYQFHDTYFYKRKLHQTNIYLYSIQSRRIEKVIDSSSAVAFTSNSRLLACSRNGEINFYDTKTFAHQKRLSCHAEDIYDIDISSSNKTIVTASLDGTIKQWDIASGKCLCTLSQKNNPVISKKYLKYVSYSPDGGYIAAVLDNILILWDSGTGEQVRAYKGHTGEIANYSFSSDGRWIVTTSMDGTIKVWNVQTGFVMWDLKPQYTRYFSTFSEDNKKIISVLATGRVEIYDFLPLSELIEKTRKQFNDNPLTLEDRRRYYLE